jgi:hypothetical protein
VLTASTASVGHAYWESRVETHLGTAYARAAKDVILGDTRQADAHLARIISPTLFSVGTNRALFKGLVHLAETRGFQSGLKAAVGRSRWSLTDVDVERHLGLSYDYMVDLLASDSPAPRKLDPSGEQPLHVAKAVRRQVLQAGAKTRPSRLLDAAEEHFGLPDARLLYWPDRVRPLPWRAPAPARERRRAEA